VFRHERPQKGRYRQFHQIDVEALGHAGPDVDAEQILMCRSLLQDLGLAVGKDVRLEINSLGQPNERSAHRAGLIAYLEQHADALDEDSRRRLHSNPLRILDSKNPELQEIIAAAPVLTEYLDEPSRQHFDGLRRHLDAMAIPYVLNPRLVRGLDYYSHTVFEWVTNELGSQGAVCSGGRYDGLVTQLGGEPTPAVGWALGEERIVELLRVQAVESGSSAPDIYLVIAGSQAEAEGLQLAERLRDAVAGVRIETNCGGGSFKSQLKRADKSGAAFALILGDAETERRVAGLKSLRTEGPQAEVSWDQLPAELTRRLQKTS